MDIRFVIVYFILFHANVIVLSQLQYILIVKRFYFILFCLAFVDIILRVHNTNCEFKAKLIDELIFDN